MTLDLLSRVVSGGVEGSADRGEVGFKGFGPIPCTLRRFLGFRARSDGVSADSLGRRLGLCGQRGPLDEAV